MKKGKRRSSSCTCAICNKPLSDPKSVRQGIGPICWARIMADLEGNPDEYVDRMLDLGLYPLDEAVVLIRDAKGIITNVPRIVEKHSPTGYEWGYGGSGPAELALNITEYYVRILGNQGYEIGKAHKEREGVVHDATYMIYQDLKQEFLCSMEREGGRIAANEIMERIKDSLITQKSMF